ncbi:MAG: HIT family protein [Rhodoglobus sp.]
MTDIESCWLCELGTSFKGEDAHRERVRLTEHWRVITHKSGLPGWLLVVARRHVLGIADLSVDEAADLGGQLREASRALVETLGAQKTYVMQFSEDTPHLHFSVVPRMPDIPNDRKGFAVAEYNAGEVQTESERDAIALRLTDAWTFAQR